jgi:hypothetical protein
MYLALPNCWEIDAIITNSQGLLALSVFLQLVAARPRSAGWRWFDLWILSLCGLTGPFCIFLLPIALFLAWKDRDHWRWVKVGVLAAACSVQTLTLLNGGYSNRPHYSLGANPAMFVRILAGQVYLGALLGGVRQGPDMDLRHLIVFTGIAILGTILVIVCLLRAPLPMKLFLLFSAMLLASSLISPTLGKLAGVTAWETLVSGAGNRYWFFPTLAFAWTILWCFQSGSRALKTLSAILLCCMCFTISFRWRHPPYQDMHFTEYASKFETAPPGTVVTIPQNPEGWTMTLVKHPNSR